MNFKKLLLALAFIVLINTVSAATTFTVTEGELVKFELFAQDPDDDAVNYYFQSPLNASGQWQTTLEDSGIYHTKVVASDGQSQTEKEIIIQVKNKNQPPEIKDQEIFVKETETIDLKKLISDPDGDDLKLIFQRPFNQDGLWIPTYQDAGAYTTTIIASDLEDKVTQKISIKVEDKNQPPQIISSFSEDETIYLIEDSAFPFSTTIKDFDLDKLDYSWLLDNQKISSESAFEYYFDFDSAGLHELILIVSDKKEETRQTWNLEIENLNRPPKIDHPDIVVNEGETIIIKLPDADIDQDPITYTFLPPFQNNTWQTTYQDAGTYTTIITASDGDLLTKKEIKITIKDVDRAPEISLEEITLEENELLELDLNDYISDPDGDKVKITIEDLPDSFLFHNQELQFQPDYDFVQRKANFFTDFLNRLRIEKFFFPPAKTITLPLTACGKDLCTTHQLVIKVQNINRPPVLEFIEPLSITETETLTLAPSAIDPDGDIVKFKFQKPFNRQGKFTPDFTASGTFNTTVTATDGTLTEDQQITITVLNKNRPPTLTIEQDRFKINENELLSFSLSAQDPDQDNLTLTLEEIPPDASFQDQTFSWTPNYRTVNRRNPTFLNNLYSKSTFLNRHYNDEMETYSLRFVASDGDFHMVHPVIVTIKNVNQPPTLEDYSPPKAILTGLNESLILIANFLDADNDNLTYTWDFGFWEAKVTTTHNTIKRTFKKTGVKTITVTATDGTYEAQHQWKIKVVPSLTPKQ